MHGQRGHKARLHAQFPSFQGMEAWITSQLNVANLISKLVTWVIDVLGLPFDIVSMGLYTARYWQTSGRLVQELDVGTAFALCV